MDHAHNKGAIESSVELGNYTGLVSAVLAQVSAGLSDHSTGADGDVQEHAMKRLKKLSTSIGNQTPASRAMAGRFALGADDVMYLQNAVSVLAAGHERGSDEIPIAPGEMLGANVVESVRRIVEDDMRARDVGRLAEAPGKLEQLAVSVGWLLQLDEVREGVDALDLIVVAGSDAENAYNQSKSVEKMATAIRQGGDGLAKFQNLLLQLYAMLNDEYAPGRLADEIEEAMRKSARDVDSARETMHAENLKFLRARKTELEESVATLTGELEAAKEKLTYMMGELEASNARNSQLVKQVNELGATVQQQETAIKTLKAQIAELEGRLAFKQEQLAELTNIVTENYKLIDTLNAKLAAGEVSVSSLREALAAADQEIAGLEAGARVDQADIAQRDARIDALNETRSDLEIQIEAAEVNKRQLTRDIAAVEEKLAACEKDLATTKAEVETERRLNKAFKFQVLEYSNQLEETLAMLGKKTKELSEKDEEVKLLLLQIKNLNEERAKMRAEIEELVKDRGGASAGGGGGSWYSAMVKSLALLRGEDPDEDPDMAVGQNFVSRQSVDIGAKVLTGRNISEVGDDADSAGGATLAVYEYARVAVEATQRATDPLPKAATEDDLSRYVEYRGLVGQRGPEEPISTIADKSDDHLPYSSPWEQNAESGNLLVGDTVAEHHAVADAPLSKIERHEAVHFFESASVTGVLSRFMGDFALIPVQASGSIEKSFCARWRPIGPQCVAVAKAAAFEHAAQRCRKLAAINNEAESKLLKATSGALKLRQLEALFAIHEHIEEHGDTHSVLPEKEKLVTRPLAHLRRVGKLSFPIDCGLQLAPTTTINDIDGGDTSWLNKNALTPDGEKSAYTFRALSAALQDIVRPDNSSGPPPAVFMAPEVGRFKDAVTPSPTTQDNLKAFKELISTNFTNIQYISNASELSTKRLRGLIRLGLSHCYALLSEN
ncbi:MAG: hypothetical protein CMI16_05730, partial [Opitutaceae bacterium]|nr:hypothetical protein [Opitutaceae bacterium]